MSRIRPNQRAASTILHAGELHSHAEKTSRSSSEHWRVFIRRRTVRPKREGCAAVPAALMIEIGNEGREMHQQRRQLLLVDGDVHRAQRLAGRLSGWDFDVRIAENGATGLLKAHERRPDVVVASADLPILDGFRM